MPDDRLWPDLTECELLNGMSASEPNEQYARCCVTLKHPYQRPLNIRIKGPRNWSHFLSPYMRVPGLVLAGSLALFLLRQSSAELGLEEPYHFHSQAMTLIPTRMYL
jgi:hypothetical protein